jgi:hypothetical protein
VEFNPYKEVQAEMKEHETMLLDLGLVLSTPQGQNFAKYLMKHFGVGELPAINIPDKLRDEYIGFLRAGQSIFEIVSQADNIKAGLLLAQIQKEKYENALANSNGQ